MRKYFLFAFIALLAYQFVGFFTFIEFEHFIIRKDIKKAIKLVVPDNQLICLHFTLKESKELNWVKPHEFKLKGRFYDVVHKKKVNGVWYYKCIDDKQETVLFEKLAYAIADNLVNAPERHPIHGWLKLIKEPMEPLPTFDYRCNEFIPTRKVSPSFNRQKISQPLLFVLAPPPKSLV